MSHFIYKTLALICLVTYSVSGNASNSQSTENQTTEFPGRDKDKREKYIADRLEAISKMADLTAIEKEFVGEELIKFDNNRLELFKKGRELRDKLETPGLSDKEYADLLFQVLEVDQERAKETLNLFKRFESKLSPDKQVKIYLGLRKFNSKVAQHIRSTRSGAQPK